MSADLAAIASLPSLRAGLSVVSAADCATRQSVSNKPAPPTIARPTRQPNSELSVSTMIGAAAQPIVEDVAPAEKSLGFEQLSGPRGVADDLKKLPAVSGAIEKKLNDLGIFHYWQIAGLGPEAAHNVGEEVGLPGRVGSWVAQAKALTAEAE